MEVTEKEIQSFQEVIRDYSEYDFTDYSLNSLRRRLTRILLEYDIEIDQIISRMRSDPVYMEKIVRKLTVHTTELFRDPPIWKTIRSDLLPTWSDKSSIHIWHPGCSTGQEIYSMMMLLDEVGMLEKTQLYGTDLNPDVIESAKKGKYKYHFNQHYLENFDKVMLSGSGSSTQTGTSNRNHHKPWKRYFTVNEARDSIRMSDRLRTKPVYKK
ncbi:MAG: CheR family methyltransferase, partial [Bacteroidota bacterium]